MKDPSRSAIDPEKLRREPMKTLDGGDLFRAHAAFVANFLVRLGVLHQELDDAVQEVFLIAHRRGGYVEGPARPTTWLAEIALRVASGVRRDRRRRLPDGPGEERDAGTTPFEALAAAEALGHVQRALDALPLEHRAVFILFEIEGESCASIARGLDIPIGTVYSRLHTARRDFQRAYDRLETAAPAPIVRGERGEAL
jgi:RNA polymerase sigma-70 factor (ECF subfamily)